MGIAVPASLSPSKVDSFMNCPLAFRFSAIDRLPEPPSVPATKGTLVHRALELLFCRPHAERTPATAAACLEQAVAELRASPEWGWLALDEDAQAEFVADASAMVQRYFQLEDPRTVREIGLELRLEVEMGGVILRGIIDRLELDADGELVVTDYKTGRPPREQREQGKLGGVHFYAYLCERLFGKRPARIQLLYLGEPVVITAHPSEQSIRFLPKKASALWQAVERACASEEFRARPSALCSWCSFQRWCPAYGGDPARALDEATAAYGQAGGHRLTVGPPVPSAA